MPALSLDPASDPFVPVAGGPGQSTIEFYAGWASAFERVRRNRDIVLLDQRGTGDSATMVCDIDEDVVEGKYSEQETLRLTEQCLDRLPHDPTFFTTSVAVRDLEALRIALGYDAFNMYGISYGTRVAQHYARRYPGSTRTVIIDGVVPPQLPLGPDIATESQRAIRSRVCALCRRCTNCNDRFPDVSGDFDILRGALAESPVAVEYQHPVTGQRKVDRLYRRPSRRRCSPVVVQPAHGCPAATGHQRGGEWQFRAARRTVRHGGVVARRNIEHRHAQRRDVHRRRAVHRLGQASTPKLLTIVTSARCSSKSIKTMCSIWPRGV